MKLLFRFTQGATVWTVTSSNQSETYSSETYAPITIGLSTNIESKQASNRGTLDISVDLGNAMAYGWLTTTLNAAVGLTIYSKDGATTQTVWSGQLVNIKPDMSAITLTFDDGSDDTRRAGLTTCFQTTCPYVLYGRGCWKDKSTMSATGTIATITSTGVTVSAASGHADGWYTGGMIQDAAGNLRFITNHVGTALTLMNALDGAIVGNTVTIYAGCDRSKETCKDKFSNLNNFGGYPWIPTVNIFAGHAIA